MPPARAPGLPESFLTGLTGCAGFNPVNLVDPVKHSPRPRTRTFRGPGAAGLPCRVWLLLSAMNVPGQVIDLIDRFDRDRDAYRVAAGGGLTSGGGGVACPPHPPLLAVDFRPFLGPFALQCGGKATTDGLRFREGGQRGQKTTQGGRRVGEPSTRSGRLPRAPNTMTLPLPLPPFLGPVCRRRHVAFVARFEEL